METSIVPSAKSTIKTQDWELQENGHTKPLFTFAIEKSPKSEILFGNSLIIAHMSNILH
jgi:hypothetical protein